MDPFPHRAPRRDSTAPVRPTDAGPCPSLPLASASTRSLRLLTGYLARRHTAALVASGLVPAAAAPEPLCRRSFLALATVLRTPAARPRLDALLARCFGAQAEELQALALCDLAARFLRLAPGADPDPRRLHALLWAVARRPGTPRRRLEQRLVARIETQDLLAVL